jgi:hypothetical protein
MNIERELDMPVALTSDGRPITLRQIGAGVTRASFGDCARASITRSLGCKIAYIAKAVSEVGAFDADLRKNLAIARLRESVGAEFEFLDGRRFTAAQAITEIERCTDVGGYFVEIENRAAAIACAELARRSS